MCLKLTAPVHLKPMILAYLFANDDMQMNRRAMMDTSESTREAENSDKTRQQSRIKGMQCFEC